MLSAQNRMRSGSDFSAAVRRGRRAGRQSVVLHCLTAPADRPAASLDATSPLVGFVVPKSVGNSVVRNRVQRRLRHLMRERIASLPSGARLVVRALPASAATMDLGAELDRALSVVLRPGSARSERSARDFRDSRETRGAS